MNEGKGGLLYFDSVRVILEQEKGRKTTMDYIVLDMEWNQALDHTQVVRRPIFLNGEIIQIGAVKLNEGFEIIDLFQCRVVPQHYTTLHPGVAEITKLTDADLRKGELFCDAFDAFCRFLK